MSCATALVVSADRETQDGVQWMLTLLRRSRETNMVPSLIFTGLFSAIIGFSVAAPILPGGERLIYLLLMGFIVAPLAWSLTSLAPRYIPGPEVRLIFLIEVVLGPLWVWLALGEEPPKATLLGGALVLLTLAFHAYLSLKAQSAKTSELLAGE